LHQAPVRFLTNINADFRENAALLYHNQITTFQDFSFQDFSIDAEKALLKTLKRVCVS
jgi:hypothetical protein